MIEFLLIIAFIFLVAVFFYKQALEEFDVLQIEAGQMDQLPKLLSEKSFLVLRSLPKVQLWSPSVVQEMPRIQSAPYGKTSLLEIVETGKAPVNYPHVGEQLAEQTGLRTWLETTWLPRISDSEWFKWMYTTRSEVCVGSKGLRKTLAYSTMILPTHGDVIVSVMPESSETYLPKAWRGKVFGSLKRAEAPLIGEIKYLDIKIRQGSALFLPPHWIANVQQEGEQMPWFVWAEFHHPLSKFAQMLNS